MKKICTLALLSLALFSVACSDADKASENATQAPAKVLEKYDFSSTKAFEKSFAEQCEKDGVKETEAQKAVMGIMMLEYGKDAAKIAQINDKEEQEEASLELMKKAIGNRSPMELIEYVENEYGK